MRLGQAGLVAELREDVELLCVETRGVREVVLPVGEAAGAVERLRPALRPALPVGAGEEVAGHRQSLAEVPSLVPVPPRPAGRHEPGLERAGLERPAQRRPQVVLLELDAVEPHLRVRADQLRLGGLDEPGDPVEVAIADRRDLARLGEPLEGELADRLRASGSAARRRRLDAPDEALVDERRSGRRATSSPSSPSGSAHRLGRLESTSRRRRPRGGRAGAVARLGRAGRSSRRSRRAASAGGPGRSRAPPARSAERLLEPGEERVRRRGAGRARRRARSPAAGRRAGRRSRRRPARSRRSGGSPAGPPARGRRTARPRVVHRAERLAGVGRRAPTVGQGERRDRELLLAGEVQERPARDEDRQLRAAARGASPTTCADGDDLLEVVEDEEHPLAADALGDPEDEVARPVVDRRRAPSRSRDGTSRGSSIGDRPTQAMPSGEVAAAPRGRFDAQSRLARAAGAGQGQEPVPREAGPGPRRAGLPADEARDRGVRLMRRPSWLRSGAERRAARRRTTWCSRSGSKSFSRCEPRSAKPMSPSSAALGQAAGRVGHHDLAAVGGRRDPGRAVDVDAHDSRCRAARASPVWMPDPDADRGVVRPGLGGQGALGGDRGRGSRLAAVGKTTKNESPSVPCSSPPCGRERRPQERPMALAERRVAAVPTRCSRRRRALDVREQERDRARRPGR